MLAVVDVRSEVVKQGTTERETDIRMDAPLLLLLALHRPHTPLVPRHGALVAFLLLGD